MSKNKSPFSVEKSDNKNYNWMVVRKENGDKRIVCYVPMYYLDDRVVALSIKHALESNPTKLNLEV